MGDLSFARTFRLRPGAIECDTDGLRVGGVALLARDAKGAWARRDGGEINRELSERYGLPLDCERKGGALDAVAAALTNGGRARAQVGALLLLFPDPPTPSGVRADGLEKRRLIDGQWRTLAAGGEAPNSFVYDRNGHAVARVISGPDRRQTLVATIDALDRAVADLRRKDGEPAAAPIANDNEPRLCPDPTPEAKTTKSANAIAYQEYVSGLPYGWAIVVGGVRFDGCEEATGNLLEAKAKQDHLFDLDADDALESWVYPENDPAIQMEIQVEVALGAGRKIVWHAQTEKTYQGLKTIADRLTLLYGPIVTVVYDPN